MKRRPNTKRDRTKAAPALSRSDGELLLYAERLNWLFGSPGSGKTWVALLAAVECAGDGRPVLWIDAEDSESIFAERLDVLARTKAQRAAARELVLRWQPDITASALEKRIDKRAEVLGELSDKCGRKTHVIIDSATQTGCSPDSADILDWRASWLSPFERIGAGITVIDHVVKNPDRQRQGPVGSFNKVGMVTGSSLRVHGSPWNKREGGHISLSVLKDRPGDLPSKGAVATVEGEYRSDGKALSVCVGEPSGDLDSLALPLDVRILDALHESGGMSRTNLRQAVEGSNADISATVDELIADGRIADAKVRGGLLRAADDADGAGDELAA